MKAKTLRSQRPLSKSALQAMGFTSIWPSGNPTEPWWEHDTLNLIFTERPSFQNIYDEVFTGAKKDGIRETKQAMKDALGIR